MDVSRSEFIAGATVLSRFVCAGVVALAVKCSAIPAASLNVEVKGGSAEQQADGTWLCRAPRSFEPVWVDVTGLGDCTGAIGLDYDFYASDFSVLNHSFAFLSSSDGGCTRWPDAAVQDEGVWNRISLRVDDPKTTRFDPNNNGYIKKAVDWAKITRLRLLFLRQSPKPVEFRVGHFRPVMPAKARQARPGERRFAFARVTALSLRGDWEETAAFLQKVGFTDLLACVARGGHVYYDSKYLNKSATLAADRDSVREGVAACRRHGIRYHAGKATWNAEHEDTPEEFLAQIRAEQRFQVNGSGKEVRWLCPTDPRNRELELNVLKEMAALGVDGIHLDYARYRDGNSCFCERCMRRLSERIGRTVSSAAEVKADAALMDEWIRLRVENITGLVKDIADFVRANYPGMEISASTGRTPDMGLLGRAQDWPDWARKGYLDFVSPMNYWWSPAVYRYILAQQIRHLNGTNTKLYPYIGIDCSKYSRLPADSFLRELDCIRENGLGGFAVFALDPYAEELLPQMKAKGVW